MNKLILCILLCLVYSNFYSQSAEKTFEDFGTLIRMELETAPFPHSERKNGHTYNDKIYPAGIHYQDNSVLVFIPNHFERNTKLDFVVHFHGWWNNVDSVLHTFQLIEQLSASQKNAILVIPQGPKNAPDSFGGKLEEARAFEHMMVEILSFLEQKEDFLQPEIGNIILSGHSGGYRVIAHILLHGGLEGNIKEVWIFDGLYAHLEKFTFWILKNQGKFINVYTKDGGTLENSKEFIKDMKAWDLPFLAIQENDLLEAHFLQFLFLHIFSSLEHNEVIHKNNLFQLLLANSSLQTNSNDKPLTTGKSD
ncbi:MAG: hypothetical protein GY705_22705 [Bacteroidetes bacterium]|nr:hypothetical protein [Bacteroidota bacterium]